MKCSINTKQIFQVKGIDVCNLAGNFKRTMGDRTSLIFSEDIEDIRSVVRACNGHELSNGTRCACGDFLVSFVEKNCVCLMVDV